MNGDLVVGFGYPKFPYPMDQRAVAVSEAEMFAIPTESRYIGLGCFRTDIQRVFRLIGGTDNANWELEKATPAEHFYKSLWVDLNGGDDSNDGTRNSPFLTVQAAYTARKLDPTVPYVIYVDGSGDLGSITLDFNTSRTDFVSRAYTNPSDNHTYFSNVVINDDNFWKNNFFKIGINGTVTFNQTVFFQSNLVVVDASVYLTANPTMNENIQGVTSIDVYNGVVSGDNSVNNWGFTLNLINSKFNAPNATGIYFFAIVADSSRLEFGTGDPYTYSVDTFQLNHSHLVLKDNVTINSAYSQYYATVGTLIGSGQVVEGGSVDGALILAATPEHNYKELWVDLDGGNDSNSGTRNLPFLTVQSAYAARKLDGSENYVINIIGGGYRNLGSINLDHTAAQTIFVNHNRTYYNDITQYFSDITVNNNYFKNILDGISLNGTLTVVQTGGDQSYLHIRNATVSLTANPTFTVDVISWTGVWIEGGVMSGSSYTQFLGNIRLHSASIMFTPSGTLNYGAFFIHDSTVRFSNGGVINTGYFQSYGCHLYFDGNVDVTFSWSIFKATPATIADTASIAYTNPPDGKLIVAPEFSFSIGKRTFNATTTAPPASGEVRLNNATVGSATKLFLSYTDTKGNDWTSKLFEINGGSWIQFGKDDDNKYLFKVVSIIDQSTYVEIDVDNLFTLAIGSIADSDVVVADIDLSGGAGGGGGAITEQVQFSSDLDTVREIFFVGIITVVNIIRSAGLSAMTYEVSNNNGATWTTQADIAAINSWIASNVTGNDESGTKWRLRLIATYNSGIYGLEMANVKYTL